MALMDYFKPAPKKDQAEPTPPPPTDDALANQLLDFQSKMKNLAKKLGPPPAEPKK